MKLKLVSFSVCPFVQRAVLMLREKDVAFEVEYIDLRNKPEWFLKASPRGKVPILYVDDQILFESQAICEFLEEATEGTKLFPESAIDRARDRAWFASAGEDLLMPAYKMQTSKDKASLEENTNAFKPALERLNQEMDGREWLSGDGTQFGMADVGYSSAMYGFGKLKALFGHDVLAGFSNLEAWRERLFARPAFVNSVPDTWEKDMRTMLEAYESILVK